VVFLSHRRELYNRVRDKIRERNNREKTDREGERERE